VHRHTVEWVKEHLLGIGVNINTEWAEGGAAWSEQRDAALRKIVNEASTPAAIQATGVAPKFRVERCSKGGYFLRDEALPDIGPGEGECRAPKRAAEDGRGGEEKRARAQMAAAPVASWGGSSAASGRKRAREGPQLVVAFFPETKRDDANLHGEAQELKSGLPRDVWNFEIHPRPTVEAFGDEMYKIPEDAGAFVHFAGHCKKDGTLLWVQDLSGMKEELLDSSVVVRIVKQAARMRAVECFFINGCWSRLLGKMLKEQAGVRNVLCWQGEVGDKRASAVAMCFYKNLKHLAQGRYDYKSAVEKAKTVLLTEKQREVRRGNAVPRERLCFFSNEMDDILPEHSEDDQEWGDSDGEVTWSGDESERLGDDDRESDDDAMAANPDTAATGSSMSRGAPGEPVRSATNTQGNCERDGCKQIGFRWFVNGLSMEAGIRLYLDEGLQANGKLSSGKSLREYGLKESKRALQPGSTSTKKHLYYERRALCKVFGRPDLDSYEDLFAEVGALETRVEQLEAKRHGGDATSLQQLRGARASLQTALEERQRQLAAADGRGEADENHRPMAAALARLIRRIKEAVAGPRAAPAAAGIEGSVEGMSIEGMSTVN